jgi:hypothetical protein
MMTRYGKQGKLRRMRAIMRKVDALVIELNDCTTAAQHLKLALDQFTKAARVVSAAPCWGSKELTNNLEQETLL